jgi:hypothetical protein
LEFLTLQEDKERQIWKCPSTWAPTCHFNVPSPDILLLIEVAHQHRSRCLQVLTPLVVEVRNMAPNIQARDLTFLQYDQSQLRVSVNTNLLVKHKFIILSPQLIFQKIEN